MYVFKISSQFSSSQKFKLSHSDLYGELLSESYVWQSEISKSLISFNCLKDSNLLTIIPRWVVLILAYRNSSIFLVISSLFTFSIHWVKESVYRRTPSSHCAFSSLKKLFCFLCYIGEFISHNRWAIFRTFSISLYIA